MWHGPLQSRNYYHWNEEILPVEGSDEPPMKYSVVAYAHEGTGLMMKRRPLTRWGHALKVFRRVFGQCKRRLSKWRETLAGLLRSA